MELPLTGRCAPGYESVREAFVANFTERGEIGAAVCVIRDGQVVVDLAGGWVDAAATRPWRHDTLCDFYSVGKGLLALLLLQQVDAGRIGLDDEIASVWPEFAVGGKEHATIRHALSHQAGVPAIDEPLTNEDLFDWDRMTGALAATDAWFVPGTRHVYHTNTFGHLVGELIHRITGQMPREALRALADPLDADVHFGVPVSEQHRCAEVIWPSEQSMQPLDPTQLATLEGEAAMVAKGYFNPPGYSSMGVVNTAAWRSCQVGSTAGHGSARGIARVYAALADDDRLLSRELRTVATSAQSTGPCPVLGEEVTFGLGFSPSTRRRPLGPNRDSFGHFGTGGALGFCDPSARIGFGYVMNQVIPRWQSTRNRSLIDALYASGPSGAGTTPL